LVVLESEKECFTVLGWFNRETAEDFVLFFKCGEVTIVGGEKVLVFGFWEDIDIIFFSNDIDDVIFIVEFVGIGGRGRGRGVSSRGWVFGNVDEENFHEFIDVVGVFEVTDGVLDEGDKID
jgi:hypothetical protein